MADPSTSITDQFPRYSDGDVLIVLSPTRQFQLHYRTLILHSEYFKQTLPTVEPAPLNSKARREGVVIRYRLELEVGFGDRNVGEFHPRELDERGRMNGAYSASDLDNGKVPLPIYRHYDNLFRLFYYQPVNLHDSNISEVLRDVVGLADVAEHLGSMHTVSLVVDNALVKQGQLLYRSIASNAAAWADLAFRIRSELILREALIHMVGQWARISKEENTLFNMRPEVRLVCEKKHKELDDVKRAIELRIMGHYPQHMQRPANNNVGPGSRTIRGTGKSTRANAYASDSFAWMALNLFRHWLGQHVTGDLNRHAPDGGFNFYHALHQGAEAYIDHNAIESFAKYFPLSAKARNSFLSQLNILKTGVSPYVEQLVENKSMLDITRWPVRYLTCLNVVKSDMPWHVPTAGEANMTATNRTPVENVGGSSSRRATLPIRPTTETRPQPGKRPHDDHDPYENERAPSPRRLRQRAPQHNHHAYDDDDLYPIDEGDEAGGRSVSSFDDEGRDENFEDEELPQSYGRRRRRGGTAEEDMEIPDMEEPEGDGRYDDLDEGNAMDEEDDEDNEPLMNRRARNAEKTLGFSPDGAEDDEEGMDV